MKRIVCIVLLFVGYRLDSNAQCVRNCQMVRTYQFANGDKYEGQWKDGKMHGSGKYEFANGIVIMEISTTINVMELAYVWKNKGSYTGQWKEGKREGSGVFKWEK